MRQDIFRRLTFGIKKTTRRIDRSKEDESSTASLRLRVLPENIKEELRALRRAKNDHHNQKEDIRDERQEENREDIPEPFIDFEDLNLPSVLLSSLKEFGVTEPTPIQMQAIPLLTVHRDILASAPTEPTRELAAQTYRQFLKYGQHLPVRPALFENEDIPKNVDILVSTPNRLTHHLQDVILKYLRWLVVDESDRLFEAVEGQERCFRNQLATIYKACDGKFTRRAFFSATFSYEVEEWCKENLSNVAVVCIGERNSANANVTQELVFAGSEYGKLVAIRTLLQTQFEPPALIFVQSKERARELLTALSSLTPPIPVSFISSEKSQSEREAVVESFRLGQVWVLICTELMGRGLDLRNVNLVINYDLPTSIVSYIHRIGRTGRAGRHGRAVTYFTESDTKYLRPIATVIHQAGFEVPEYTLTLKPLSRPVLLG
uniref:RNA helicase n=1 Tax=Angiostrongylus cantonensis TaxID=6313 RepID=A0A0K0DIK7_ANGCA